MTMHVVVDPERCTGELNCVLIAPEVFEISDDGVAVVVLDPVPGRLEDRVIAAAGGCPVAAITCSESEE